MGRGRQKAKQTKVARDLKYYSPPTDYASLQRELGGRESVMPSRDADDEKDPNEDDDGGWASRR